MSMTYQYRVLAGVLVGVLLVAGLLASTAMADHDRGRGGINRNIDQPDGTQMLEPPTSIENDKAGTSVATDDGVLVIGGPQHLDTGPGTAWVHRWNGTTNEWDLDLELSTLLPEGTIEYGDSFGHSVAIHLPYIIVGAPFANDVTGAETGRVFVFKGPDEFLFDTVIDSPSGALQGWFGGVVAVSSHLVFASAPREPNDGGGFGVVYAHTLGRGIAQALPLPRQRGTSVTFDGVGYALAHDGTTLVVGAPLSTVNETSHGLVLTYDISSGLPVFDTTLYPPAPWDEKDAVFGYSVAASNNTVLIGAPFLYAWGKYSGAVSFERSGPGDWTHSGTLVEDPPLANGFGTSVALVDEMAVVGAIHGNGFGPESGHASIFYQAGTTGEWSLRTTIWRIYGEPYDHFGFSAAISDTGNRSILIGGPRIRRLTVSQAGGVVSFTSAGEWQEDVRPVLPVQLAAETIDQPGWTGDYQTDFGHSLAVWGNTALVADRETDSTGEVTLLERTSSEANWQVVEDHWIQRPKSLPAAADFGYSVAIAADIAVVGAPTKWGEAAGSVQIYTHKAGVWYHLSEISSNDFFEAFGAAVAVVEHNGQYVIAVGAPHSHNDFRSGRVEVYTLDPASGETQIEDVLTPMDYTSGRSNFGISLSLDVDHSGELSLAVGNSYIEFAGGTGQADVYRRVSGTGWQHEQSIEPGDEFPGTYSTVGFGHDVAIDNGLLVVGAPLSSLFGYSMGDAFLFSRTVGVGKDPWTLESYLDSPTQNATDQFGYSVELDQATGTVWVGIPFSSYFHRNAGAIAVFRHDADAPWSLLDWTTTSLLGLITPEPDATLGFELAADDDLLLAAAPNATPWPYHAVHPKIAQFVAKNVVSWIGVDNLIPLSSADAWATAPQGADDALFSLLLAPYREVLFDVPVWLGSIEIALDQLGFQLGVNWRGSITPTIQGNLTIAGVPEAQAAWLSVTGSDAFAVTQRVILGDVDKAGTLSLDGTVVQIGETLQLFPGGSIEMFLSPDFSRRGQSLINPRIDCTDPPTLAGTLSVKIRGGYAVEDFELGQQFTLITAASPPLRGGEAFDLVVLPGLTDALAFQLSYGGSNLEGGGWSVGLEVVGISDLISYGNGNSTVVSAGAIDVEIVDLTGDLAEEVCVLFDGTPGQLVIFENDGAGGVIQQIILATGDEPVDLTTGDFDNDGHMDLAVANHLSQNISVYLNDDGIINNGFVSADFVPGVIPTCLTAFDYLGLDALDDLVIGFQNPAGTAGGFIIFAPSMPLRGFGFGGGEQTLTTSGVPAGVNPNEDEKTKDLPFGGITGDGKGVVGKVLGGLTAAGPLLTLDTYSAGTSLQDVRLSDINGDKLVDVICTSAGNNSIVVLLQDTANPGEFLSALQFSAGHSPTSLSTVDLDSDGNVDIATVTTNADGNRVVRVFQNGGNLSFTNFDLGEADGPLLVDAGDIDGDGNMDLVTIGSGGSFLLGGDLPVMTVRNAEGSCSCPGDVDCTGSVDVEDLLAVVSDFGCVSGCAADADDDGDVDIEDLLLVVSGWGSCR